MAISMTSIFDLLTPKCIRCLGRVDITQFILLRILCILNRYIISAMVLCYFLDTGYMYDDCMSSVFLSGALLLIIIIIIMTKLMVLS